VGCGACRTICPESDIVIEDREGERVVSVRGEVVVRIKLHRCEGCKVFHVPVIFVEQLTRLVEVPHEIIHQNLCPACKRIKKAAAIMGQEPDFSWMECEEMPPEPSPPNAKTDIEGQP